PHPPRAPVFPYTTLFRSSEPRSILRRLSRQGHAKAQHAVGKGVEQALQGIALLQVLFRHHLGVGLHFGFQCALEVSGKARMVDEDRKSTRLNSSHVKISY